MSFNEWLEFHMKNVKLVTLGRIAIYVGIFTLLSGCERDQGATSPLKIMEISQISEDTLSCAKQNGFDYSVAFEKARTNDYGALNDLIRFSRHTDGGASLGHSKVLVYLIQRIGDDRFSNAVKTNELRTKEVVRLLLEAGVVSGPNAPNVPLQQFAPQTYQVLVSN